MLGFVFTLTVGVETRRDLRGMCETLPRTLAGPIQVTSFLLFLLLWENGGDKRDNLN